MNRIPFLRVALLALLMLLLAACASSPTGSASKRDLVFLHYAAAIRWSDFDKAWQHVDPFYRQEHPFEEFQRERYKQIQITAYEVRDQLPSADGLVIEQNVELKLVNRHTQVERTLLDRQRWRYDPLAKRWWLETGLPDLDAR